MTTRASAGVTSVQPRARTDGHSRSGRRSRSRSTRSARSPSRSAAVQGLRNQRPVRLAGARAARPLRTRRPWYRHDVRREQSAQVCLTENDDVVEALAPNGANDSFREWILPRTRWTGEEFCDSHPRHAATKRVPVDAVSISSNHRGVVSSGNASTTCCAAHSAVGCSVMLTWTMRRRWWACKTRTNTSGPSASGPEEVHRHH